MGLFTQLPLVFLKLPFAHCWNFVPNLFCDSRLWANDCGAVTERNSATAIENPPNFADFVIFKTPILSCKQRKSLVRTLVMPVGVINGWLIVRDSFARHNRANEDRARDPSYGSSTALSGARISQGERSLLASNKFWC